MPAAVPVAVAHSILRQLDYASAGHTGFAGTSVANTFGAGPQVFQAGASAPGVGSPSECWGAGAAASGGGATGLGNSALASADLGTAAGYNAQATGTYGTAVGASAVAYSGSTAVGAAAHCLGDSCIAVGSFSTVSAGVIGGAVFGQSSSVTANRGIVFGLGNTATHVAATCIGTGLASSRQQEVTFGCDGSVGGGWTGGYRLRIVSTTSDTQIYALGGLDSTWKDATAATRKGATALYAFDFNGVQRNGLEAWADGTAGRCGLFTPSSAPDDNHLANGEISFWLDEVGNNLKVRTRTSSGALKTGTVALS